MNINPTQQSVLNTASKDKFLLVLNLPFVLKQQTSDLVDIDPLQVTVHGTVVPTVQVPSTQVAFGGQTINVSSHTRPNYDPITVNFMVDNQFRNYFVLWKWLSILNSPRESVYAGTPTKLETYQNSINRGNMSEYQSIFSIFGLNEYNEKVVEFIYYNAFITSLGAINYSYRDPEIIESSATFQFNQLDVNILK